MNLTQPNPAKDGVNRFSISPESGKRIFRHFNQWFLLILLFIGILIYCCLGLAKVEFHPDESQGIATSASFEAYVSANLTSPVWDVNYYTVVTPPLTRYAIGVGRWLGGYGEASLNQPWDFSGDFSYNKLNGNVPSDGLLLWSRFPMAIFTALIFLGCHLILEKLSGKPVGFLGLFLMLINSFLLLTLRRAMNESPLLLFIVAALLVAGKILAIPNQDQGLNPYHSLYLFLLFGVCAGLAESSKLNGIAVLGGGFLMAVIVYSRMDIEKTLRLRLILLSILTLILSSQLMFLVLNPFLWPNPLIRTKMMFDCKVIEMGDQFAIYPASQIAGVLDHVMIPLKRIFQDYATVHFNGALFLNLPFFLVGSYFLLGKSWQYLRKRETNAAALALVIIGFITSFPALLTPLDWDRYFLLPVFFSTIAIAVGVWLIVLYTIRLLRPVIRFQPKMKWRASKP